MALVQTGSHGACADWLAVNARLDAGKVAHEEANFWFHRRGRAVLPALQREATERALVVAPTS
eukprot:431813-Pleurochrysis_carterae.AAC.2